MSAQSENATDRPVLGAAVPILFVRDVTAAAQFYASRLGFATDFLHGTPPFYGAVSRGEACLHLRFVAQPNFADLGARETSLILATIEVSDVKALFDHVELKLGQPPSVGAAHAGGSRKFPRMHMVRGHLVRRQDSVFWRSAHIRGGAVTEPPMPVTRRVRLA